MIKSNNLAFLSLWFQKMWYDVHDSMISSSDVLLFLFPFAAGYHGGILIHGQWAGGLAIDAVGTFGYGLVAVAKLFGRR